MGDAQYPAACGVGICIQDAELPDAHGAKGAWGTQPGAAAVMPRDLVGVTERAILEAGTGTAPCGPRLGDKKIG